MKILKKKTTRTCHRGSTKSRNSIFEHIIFQHTFASFFFGSLAWVSSLCVCVSVRDCIPFLRQLCFTKKNLFFSSSFFHFISLLLWCSTAQFYFSFFKSTKYKISHTMIHEPREALWWNSLFSLANFFLLNFHNFSADTLLVPCIYTDDDDDDWLQHNRPIFWAAAPAQPTVWV